MILKIFIVILLVVSSFYFDISLSVSLMNRCWTVPLWKFLALFFLVAFAYDLCRAVLIKVFSFFSRKPDASKGVGYLQEAFSGMLIKDTKVVIKALEKARKHLGDIPFVSWLEGQLCLINGDTYRAKSLFFNLSAKEKNTVLGAYSLAQLSLQDKTDKESVEAIKSILDVYPDSQNFIDQIISLSVKNGNIDDAFRYLKKLSTDNKKNIEAVIYFEKWKRYGFGEDISDLKKAYKLAPQISDIAISYATELVKEDETRSAKKVLLKSFTKLPSVEVFKKYITLCDDEIKGGEKLLKAAPQSWIPYYYLARTCLREDMIAIATEYISKAYEIAPYDFIADEIVKINASLDREMDLDLSKSRHINVFWRCSRCGDHSLKWQPVCSCCMSVASYSYVEEVEESLPSVL